MTTLSEQQSLDERYIMPTFARKPVCFVEGEGMRLRDTDGREYLDFLGGIACASLGHCHPKVVAAIEQQAKRLMIVSNYYYIEQRGEVALMLSDMLGGTDDGRGPWQSFFGNSGAESNECAMKLARLYAKRSGNGGNTIVTLQGSFHGRTMETLAATAQPVKQELFQPLPEGFVHVPINEIDALQGAFAGHGSEICAVMVEVIQGEGGVHPCTEDYLRACEELCRTHGALLICDEVQTGVNRTGKPFAFQHFGISPDIVTTAKGIAGGFPTGACSAREDIARVFEPGVHGTTFGGANLAMAAAHATLHAMADKHIAENAAKVGTYLRDALVGLPHVTEVRGMGLMVGAELDGVAAPDVVVAGLDAGLVLNATGPTTLRFLPPLICSTADVDELVERLEPILQSAS